MLVSAERSIKPLVGRDPQELSDDLDREHFAVRQGGRGTALAQLLRLRANAVVGQTEHGCDEGLEVHGRAPVGR